MIRFQGMNGLGPIGACLIQASLFLGKPMLQKPLVSKRFFRSLANEKSAGLQDHTSSPSASSTLVRSAIRVHRIPPRAGDVAQRPSEWDRMAANIEVIWVGRQAIFLKFRIKPWRAIGLGLHGA
jgi:hypothetical protein